MFGHRYFGSRYYGPAYFGDGSDTEATVDENRGGWLYEYETGEKRRKGLEWDKRPDDLRERLESAYSRIVGGAPVEAAEPVTAAVQPFVAASYDTATPPAAAVDWQALARDLAAVDALVTALRTIEEEAMHEEDAVLALLLS